MANRWLLSNRRRHIIVYTSIMLLSLLASICAWVASWWISSRRWRVSSRMPESRDNDTSRKTAISAYATEQSAAIPSRRRQPSFQRCNDGFKRIWHSLYHQRSSEQRRVFANCYQQSASANRPPSSRRPCTACRGINGWCRSLWNFANLYWVALKFTASNCCESSLLRPLPSAFVPAPARPHHQLASHQGSPCWDYPNLGGDAQIGRLLDEP